ncbi:MAG: hypothetical protein QG652_1443 [Pseudomonadota bacterium]|nr:hypothetical protein [Pseudomonadota bacterium]
MAELIIEIHDAHRRMPAYRHIARFPLRIGRGYSNDIILNDPYVAAEHVVIDTAENGWQLRQLDTVNPPLHGGKLVAQNSCEIHSGDELVLGKTLMRFFSPQHPVAPARGLHDSFAGMLEVTREFLAVSVLLLVLWLAQMLNEFLVTSESMPLQRLAADTLPVVGAALLWAMLWSLIAFVVRRKMDYLFFLSVTIFYFLADMLLENAINYVAFNTRDILLPEILSYITGGVLMMLMFYASMGHAMTMSRRRKLVLSNVFAWTLVAVLGFVMQANQPAFNPDPEYPAVLKPLSAQWAETQSMDDFLQESEKLFDVLKK